MNIDWTKIVALAMPIVTVIVNQIIERRPHLISYIGHFGFVPFFNPDQSINMIVTTHSVILRNAGRKTANNVRVGHFTLPNSFNIVPNIKYSIEPLANNGSDIVFPTLVPKEEVTISYIYSNPMTFDQVKPTYVKSDEGFAKMTNVILTPQFPKWANRLFQFLMLAGISITFYYLLKIVQVIYHMVTTPPA